MIIKKYGQVNAVIVSKRHEVQNIRKYCSGALQLPPSMKERRETNTQTHADFLVF